MTKKEFDSLRVYDKVFVNNRIDIVEDIQRRDSEDMKGGMILIAKVWIHYTNVEVANNVC